MCGISAEIRFDGGVADVGAVAAMCDQLAPRGPDGSGCGSPARSPWGTGG
ncbi:hypothetical protein ACFQX8_16800 [Klenkia terrae]